MKCFSADDGRFLGLRQLLHMQLAVVTGINIAPNFLNPFLRLRHELGRRCPFQLPSSPFPLQLRTRRSPPSCFAAISSPHHIVDIALAQEQVSRSLEGVPVYTISNAGNEFVLISDPEGSKSLSLLCFRQQDAEALLSQVRDREPVLGRNARVVSVPLEKVYKLTAEGIAFRFLPDPTQVKNAIEAKIRSGAKANSFDGVPVFQSENLILRSSDRRFIPIFFRKEDLEKALSKASKDMRKSDPSLRASLSIQVGSFEDVLKKLELNDDDSGWGDLIFVPPGKDVVLHLGKAMG